MKVSMCVPVFGSQPPISIAAPMPIHSRQRLPFANAPPPQIAPQVCFTHQLICLSAYFTVASLVQLY